MHRTGAAIEYGRVCTVTEKELKSFEMCPVDHALLQASEITSPIFGEIKCLVSNPFFKSAS